MIDPARLEALERLVTEWKREADKMEADLRRSRGSRPTNYLPDAINLRRKHAQELEDALADYGEVPNGL